MGIILTGAEAVSAYSSRWPAFLPLALSDRTAPDAAQRLEQASRWTDTAAPLLAAYLAIYDAHDRAYSTEHQASRDVLLRMYAGNLSDLHDEIEAVRDEALSEAGVTAHHVLDTPEAIEIADATNDWLADEVVSVRDAIDAAFRQRSRAL